MSQKVRINKYLASLGIASRRSVDKMIDNRKITVNGELAQPGRMIDSLTDEIAINGKKITQNTKELEYWKVYKPQGYVSTVSDDLSRPTVTQLIQTKARIFPIGRLDIDSEGLMLLTNDGMLTQKLTHPSHHVTKTYHVWATGIITFRSLQRLQRGVVLSGKRTKKIELTLLLDESEVLMTELENMSDPDNFLRRFSTSSESLKMKWVLTEGRNRQIRRMCTAVNLEVKKLKRISIGKITLGKLKPGEYAKVTKDMI